MSPLNESLVRSENKCLISSLNHEIGFYGRNVGSDTDNMKKLRRGQREILAVRL